jgi:hypothetical protein
VTDPYAEAIEQLGSDNLDVRIGGVYALERIALDSAEDYPMKELTKFIREHSREPWLSAGPGVEVPEWAARRDVQAAFTVIVRRNAKRDILPLDLTGAVLDRAYLTGANFTGANLTDAVLTRANLTRAVLTGADLTDADLRGAMLGGANLTDANLTDAALGGAALGHADLRGADLRGPDLYGARWPEGVQVPDGWMADGGSGRLKRAGRLSEVMTHYL